MFQNNTSLEHVFLYFMFDCCGLLWQIWRLSIYVVIHSEAKAELKWQ